jgi:uridine kinase
MPKTINLEELNSIIKIISKHAKDKKLSETIFIAVSGGSATGKTSQVSKAIKSELENSGVSCKVLSQDNFQFGKDFVDQFEEKQPENEEEENLYKKIQKYKWDLTENFDLPNCFNSLNILKDKGFVEIPNFDVISTTRKGTVNFTSSKVVIFEGLYSFYKELEDFPFFLKIYVETPFYARLLKRYFRFVYQMQIPKPEKALKQIFSSVLSAHKDFVEKQIPISDYIIEVPYSFEKTIEILNLKPKNESREFFNYISGENRDEFQMLREILFDENGKIMVVKNNDNEKFYFVVVYKSQVWEYLEISGSIKDLILGSEYDKKIS